MNPSFKKGFVKVGGVLKGTAKMLGPVGTVFAGLTAYDIGSRTNQAMKKPKGRLNVPSSFYGAKRR